MSVIAVGAGLPRGREREKERRTHSVTHRDNFRKLSPLHISVYVFIRARMYFRSAEEEVDTCSHGEKEEREMTHMRALGAGHPAAMMELPLQDHDQVLAGDLPEQKRQKLA